VEAYPDFITDAAVLCWHLVKNHPLPDGNKRCAFLATVEFVERNGREGTAVPGDPDETDRVIRGVAAGELDETAFRAWIAERIRQDLGFQTGPVCRVNSSRPDQFTRHTEAGPSRSGILVAGPGSPTRPSPGIGRCQHLTGA
jgi:hypothetical protein